MNMRAAAAAFFLLTNSSVAAQSVVLKHGNRYFDPTIAARDSACVENAVDVLSDAFEGVTAVEFYDTGYWDSQLEDVQFFSFFKSIVRSEFGNVEAQILCIIDTASNSIVETAFGFDKLGLNGSFRRQSLPEGVNSVVRAYSSGRIFEIERK